MTEDISHSLICKRWRGRIIAGGSIRVAATVTPHVDYAIIRGHVEIMVGPESESTGWVPEGLESSRAPR